EEAKSIGVGQSLNKSQSKRGIDSQYTSGAQLDRIPSGLSKADVKLTWEMTGEIQNLVFYGGITAAYQNEDGSLEARNGWAVVDVGDDRMMEMRRLLEEKQFNDY
ncbi:MAG: hypothetical protein EZS28_053251, partial [Streblomastix strix]